MNQQNNIDLIEQYLNNELSESERQEVENQLATDHSLSNEFDRRHTAHKMIDFMVSENLRQQLKDLEAEETKVVPLASRSRRMYALAIAACVIILMGAFFFIIPSDQNLSSTQLALNLYETPVFTMRGTDAQTIDANVALGIEALTNKNYDQAIVTLEQVTSGNAFYIMAKYYLGHANFLKHNFQAALNNFAEVISSNDVRYLEDAQWYQLLSCMGLNNACQDLLSPIILNTRHLHHAEALEIQNQQIK
ncbi:MAG: hypothetical protein IPL46_05570 [Saprospiraceae bacterium]|nr:hypothetical protein [Saprospiraceae bacterium]